MSYEQQRAENIAQNRLVLQELAITQNKVELGQLSQKPRRVVKRKAAIAPSTQQPVPRRSSRVPGVKQERSYADEQADHWQQELEAMQQQRVVQRASDPRRPMGKEDLSRAERAVLERLLKVRSELAKKESLQSYKICHTRTLCELIRLRPTSKQELLQLYGMAQKRVKSHGAVWLAAVSDAAKAGLLPVGRRPVLDDSEEEDEEDEAEMKQEKVAGGALAAAEAGATARMKAELARPTVNVTTGHDAVRAGVKSNPRGFIGVYRAQGKGARWRAQIVRPRFSGPDARKYLGTFVTLEEAARAYDVAARSYEMPCNFD